MLLLLLCFTFEVFFLYKTLRLIYFKGALTDHIVVWFRQGNWNRISIESLRANRVNHRLVCDMNRVCYLKMALDFCALELLLIDLIKTLCFELLHLLVVDYLLSCRVLMGKTCKVFAELRVYNQIVIVWSH